MKKIVLIGLTTLYISLGFAVSAIPDDINFEQQDGSIFEGNLKGDEWFSWIEDKNGNIIKYNDDSKNYEYAIIEEVNGEIDLMPSGIMVSSENNNSNAPSMTITSIRPNIKLLGQIWKRKRREALEEFNPAKAFRPSND
jgi:hypothetical protein